MSATTSRRAFLTILASGAVVAWAPRAAQAEPAKRRAKALVLVFQRGAVDGLSMVPPFADPNYAAYRPSIAIPAPGAGDGAAIPLDATFAMHPAMAPLAPLWEARRLAIVHAVGSPDATRSHFDAQDFVETGTPGLKSTDDGWLNRLLGENLGTSSSPLRGIAMQPNLPRILAGPSPTIAMNQPSDLRVAGSAAVARDFEHMYAGAVDQALRGTAGEAFDAMRTLQAIQTAAPPSTAPYPDSPLGKRLRSIAQLLRADVGVEVAVTDCGGWDTHAGQGASKGQLASRLDDLASSIAAFATDLGDRLDDTCLVTVTEFGRTARENGTKGTDHGHGSVMLALGGKVRGKRVVAKWPGLAQEKLWQARDLAVTTDHRDVFAEIARQHLGVKDLERVFPSFTPTRVGLF
jgi:uncharacterized protein (DUF1501 family)